MQSYNQIMRRAGNFPQLISKNFINSTRNVVHTTTQSKPLPFFLVASGAFGATLAIPYAYNEWANKRKPSYPKLAEEATVCSSTTYKKLPASAVMDLKISRSVIGPRAMPNDKRLVLLQYETCPFCCKVRAFLDYAGLSYDVVEVNPVFRQQLSFSSYRKVPIVLVVDKELTPESTVIQLNDSSAIISILGTHLARNGKESLVEIADLYREIKLKTGKATYESQGVLNKYFLMFGDHLTEKQYKEVENDLLNERRWRKWVDEIFVHTLSPNIYKTPTEAIQAFKHFSLRGNWDKEFGDIERTTVIYVGAFVMYLVGKYLKQKYNLNKNVRLSLYQECNFFIKNVKKHGDFMGGKKPNLADLAMFGALNSIEGCLAFHDLMNNTSMKNWYNAMKQQITENLGKSSDFTCC